MAGAGDTLIINVGGSSIKFSLYRHGMSFFSGEVQNVDDFIHASKLILEQISNAGFSNIEKVAYRVVYGGKYKKHVLLNESVISELKHYAVLDPVHMNNTLNVIGLFMHYFKAKHIACFDTVFSSKMPDIASTYAIPKTIAEKYNITRYGFHGLSHECMANEAEKLLNKKGKIITCQLGNGVSISAIKDGKCIDTSMGFTPLEGVMMATRSGSIDPAIIEYLCKKENKSVTDVTNILQKESGFKGFTGKTDIREILKQRAHGNSGAKFAVNLFCYQIRKQIGAYIAALNGVDAVVLGGGMSRNKPILKELLMNMEELGIAVDSSAVDKNYPNISKGKVKIFVIEPDEQELMLKISSKF